MCAKMRSDNNFLLSICSSDSCMYSKTCAKTVNFSCSAFQSASLVALVNHITYSQTARAHTSRISHIQNDESECGRQCGRGSVGGNRHTKKKGPHSLLQVELMRALNKQMTHSSLCVWYGLLHNNVYIAFYVCLLCESVVLRNRNSVDVKES